MQKLLIFIKSIFKNGIWFLSGSMFAVLFQWIPLFNETWFDINKSILAIIFLSLGFLGSIFKSRVEIKNKNEELEKILYEKYNLPQAQEQILNKVYKGDISNIIKEFQGGKPLSSNIKDLKEDNYIEIKMHGSGILDLKCTIKGKKYIEKRL